MPWFLPASRMRNAAATARYAREAEAVGRLSQYRRIFELAALARIVALYQAQFGIFIASQPGWIGYELAVSLRDNYAVKYAA